MSVPIWIGRTAVRLFRTSKTSTIGTCAGSVHAWMLDPSLKAGQESFCPIERWIRENVLSSETVDIVGKPFLGNSSAEKRNGSGGPRNVATKRLTGRRPRSTFGNSTNILSPPCANGNAYDAETVLSAMDVGSHGVKCEIVDALEAAFVGYFFDPKLMREHFDTHCSYL